MDRTLKKTLHPSGASIFTHCPGALYAQNGLPAKDRDMTAAESGRRIHKRLEHMLECTFNGVEYHDSHTEGMTRDERDTAYWLFRYATSLFRKWGRPEEIGFETKSLFEMEGMPIWRGRMDAVWYYPESFSVLDFKSGWGIQTPATRNEQLRIYIASVSQQAGEEMKKGFGHIVTRSGIDTAEFNRDDLAQARKEAETVWRNQSARGERIPGRHCRYCRAYMTGRCPESQEAMFAITKAAKQELTPADLSRLLAMAKPVSSAIKELRKEAKEILKEDPEAIPGWELAPGRTKREIVDVATAFKRLSRWLSEEEFVECCKVTIGRLRDRMRANEKDLTKKNADVRINDTLKDVIETKMSAGVLKEKKD